MRLDCIAVAALSLLNTAAAQEYEIDKDETVFAVVTHKGGIASALAHNHFIFPVQYEARVWQEGDAVESGRFRIEFPAAQLTPDVKEAEEKWYPRIEALGILEKPFPEVSDENRAKIKEAMLSDKQLDAENHPAIAAEVTEIRKEPSKRGDATFTHAVNLRFTAHGETVEKAIPARIAFEDGVLTVEATGRYRFTEFGMEPYSAFLGAVETQDEFDLYVHLVARRG